VLICYFSKILNAGYTDLELVNKLIDKVLPKHIVAQEF